MNINTHSSSQCWRLLRNAIIGIIAALLASCNGFDGALGGRNGSKSQYGTGATTTYFTTVQNAIGSINSTVYLRNLAGMASPIYPAGSSSVAIVDPDFDPQNDRELFVMPDINGFNNIFMSWNSQVSQLTTSKFNHHNPRFSSDGNTIVYARDMPGGDREIFSTTPGVGIQVETQLTANGGKNNRPSVSFDNQTVIFSSDALSAGNPKLFTIPIGGGTTTQITFDGQQYDFPSFLSDSQTVVCCVQPANTVTPVWVLVKLTLNSPSPLTVLNTPVTGTYDEHPRSLSNGTVLVFDRFNSSQFGQIYSMPPTVTGGINPSNLSSSTGNYSEQIAPPS